MVFELLIAQVMFKNRSGFSLFELMVVVAIIGLLTAIVIPSLMRANLLSRQKTCVNNLREIDQAIQQWAMETKAQPTDVVVHTNLIPFLRVLPVCPSVNGGSFVSDYGMTFVQDPPYCVSNNALGGTPHVFIPSPPPTKSGPKTPAPETKQPRRQPPTRTD